MAHRAPYHNAMRLGQGFNTFTQEIRLEDAVLISNRVPKIPGLSAVQAAAHAAAQAAAQPPAQTPAETPAPTPAGTPPPAEDAKGPEVNVTPPTDATPQNGGDAVAAPAGDAAAAAAPAPATPPADPTKATMSSLYRASNAADDKFRSKMGTAASIFEKSALPAVYELAPKKAITSQKVTYSTRAIENISDIMDALNISTAMSISYGTIHGNGNAAFVNENKVLDSQLNYVVSVSVTNDENWEQEDCEFQGIEDLPPEEFTKVYGDTFISGFMEGGEFNAIISIQVNDKRKLRKVKQAVDLQLAFGPSPVNMEMNQGFDKSHMEALQDTEITISVNWSGGGEIKKPDVPWSLQSVVQVANAFPSMVAQCSSRTQAILSRYESLKSFQAWRWKQYAKNKEGWANFRVLNYAPCAVYTADLFDALMQYKKLWKTISGMMQNPSAWKEREPDKHPPKPLKLITATAPGEPLKPAATVPAPADSSIVPTPTNTTPLSPCQRKTNPDGIRIAKTFSVDDEMIAADWDLTNMNDDRTPIPVDPVHLNEARLLCREAMTLITQEAARLVDHPHLAYAEFHPGDRKTQMKRPNYAYPEVLRERLPVPANNDAADSSWTDDDAALMVRAYNRDNDLFCKIDGHLRPETTKKEKNSFCTLDLNEHPGRNRPGNFITHVCLHSYHHHDWNIWSDWDHKSDDAIGAIGFRFAHDELPTSNDDCHEHIIGYPANHSKAKTRSLAVSNKVAPVDIQEIVVYFMPGSGRISGLVFLDERGTERLAMRQWAPEGERKEPPNGMECVRQSPPKSSDGSKWQFVGLAGDFIDSTGKGEVLGRVGGIWRRIAGSVDIADDADDVGDADSAADPADIADGTETVDTGMSVAGPGLRRRRAIRRRRTGLANIGPRRRVTFNVKPK